MGEIAVVTDRVACVPQDLVRQHSIHVVPFQLIWDDEGHLRIVIT
jgi:fatty acid-binding protein DegV